MPMIFSILFVTIFYLKNQNSIQKLKKNEIKQINKKIETKGNKLIEYLHRGSFVYH